MVCDSHFQTVWIFTNVYKFKIRSLIESSTKRQLFLDEHFFVLPTGHIYDPQGQEDTICLAQGLEHS